jgi:hypothetical protein
MLLATETDAIECRFRWNPAEHARFERAVFRDVQKRHPWRAALMPAVMAVAAAVSAGAAGGAVGTMVVAALAAFAIGVGASLAIGIGFVPALSSWLYARNHARCLAHDQVRVLTPEGLEAVCTISRTFIRWDGIVRVSESPEFFIFFLTRTCAIKLPKRAVADPAALRARLAVAAPDGRLRLPEVRPRP